MRARETDSSDMLSFKLWVLKKFIADSKNMLANFIVLSVISRGSSFKTSDSDLRDFPFRSTGTKIIINYSWHENHWKLRNKKASPLAPRMPYKTIISSNFSKKVINFSFLKQIVSNPKKLIPKNVKHFQFSKLK